MPYVLETDEDFSSDNLLYQNSVWSVSGGTLTGTIIYRDALTRRAYIGVNALTENDKFQMEVKRQFTSAALNSVEQVGFFNTGNDNQTNGVSISIHTGGSGTRVLARIYNSDGTLTQAFITSPTLTINTYYLFCGDYDDTLGSNGRFTVTLKDVGESVLGTVTIDNPVGKSFALDCFSVGNLDDNAAPTAYLSTIHDYWKSWYFSASTGAHAGISGYGGNATCRYVSNGGPY